MPSTNSKPKLKKPSHGPIYTHSKRLLMNRRAELAVVLLIVLLAIGLSVHATHNSKNNQPILPVVKESYSKTTNYTVTSAPAGTGLTFIKPIEFGNTNTSISSAAFQETTTNRKNKTVPLAEMAAVTTPLGTPFYPASLKAVNSTILGPQSAAHTFLAPIQQYVARNLDPGYTVALGSAKAYKTTNVKSDAWEIDLSASPTKASSADVLPVQQGALVYAISSKAFYYFFVMSDSYNWTGNQSAWNNVLNSLKVDQ